MVSTPRQYVQYVGAMRHDIRPVVSRDVAKATIEMPPYAFGFRFFEATKEEVESVLGIKYTDCSPRYFPDGKLYNLQEVKNGALLRGGISPIINEWQIKDMEHNRHDTVILTRTGSLQDTLPTDQVVPMLRQ